MELELNHEETKAALLEWAEKNFPGQFKSVEIPTCYSSRKEVTFKSKPEDKED